MARRFRISFPVLLLFAYGGWAQAQAVPVKPESAADNMAEISLGQSAVPLYGPWKFTVGDSPVDPVTHAPLWAGPGFDDSKWETVDLRSKDGSFDPIIGTSGYSPGWVARGHPGYWGYAWYRIRVHLQERPGEKLALAGPSDVDDGYQVFNNGELVGSFGDFNARTPVVYFTQPMMFALSQPAGGNPGSSTRVLAFRVWMQPNTLAEQDDVGGFHTAPVLGEAGAVAASYQIRWLELVRTFAFDAIEAVLFALLAGMAFSLTLFDRSDRVYLWMGAVFLAEAAAGAALPFTQWTQHLSITVESLFLDFLEPLIFAGWVMIWWVWFRLQRPAWLPRAVAGLTVVCIVAGAIGDDLFFSVFPHPVAVAFHMVALVVRLLLFLLLLWIVIQGIRSHGLEGWLVLPAVLLLGISHFATELNFMHIRVIWLPFGVQIHVFFIATLLLMLAVALLLLRRLRQSVRAQRVMAFDVKQAQEVQQVILPEPCTTLPGLVIESEYRPAREVGGDFFQIIPNRADGSLLIVAGDVTGKGLKAGMLVALLVGAIRTITELTSDPLTILQTLNRRLMGRGEAHATCLALRIAEDGAITLANGGHMPPYLNGEPVAMEGALPLGMIEGAEFSVTRFRLADGDKLVLVSDGIAEATDADGQLFGFERVNELLRKGKSASEVAGAAQRFGQEDDISVITVTRTAVLEPALA
jgi:Stage II sporulation protein E (SpoIIE)